MTRHWLSIVAATALGGVAAPALAQDGPPPPPDGQGWVDPQTPRHPDPRAMPQVRRPPMPMPGGPRYPGAPYAQPMTPGAYPRMPMPAPDGHGEWRDGPMPGAMEWHGGAAGDYGYGYQPVPAPCGCASYAPPPVMWVRVPVETRYHYSPPIRRVQEIVETRVVHDEVVETVPVRTTKYVRTKYVKAAAPKPVKETKGKVVRTSK